MRAPGKERQCVNVYVLTACGVFFSPLLHVILFHLVFLPLFGYHYLITKPELPKKIS